MGHYQAYPEYKNSNIEMFGQIPSSWDAKQVRYLLKDGAEGIKIGPFGSALKLEDMVDDGIRVYGQENVIQRDFSLGSRRISNDKFSAMTVYKVIENDILITMMGTSGKCIIVPESAEVGIIDSHLLRVRVKENQILPSFFRLLIDESPEIANQIKIAGKGSIMHGLNSSIVKSLRLPLPSVPEQISILQFLDHETAKIDSLIEKQQKLIQLLKEKRQAVISHAVTEGLNPSAPMKDSGVEWLGEVPEHWEVHRLKQLVTAPLMYGANEAALDTDIECPRFIRITDVLPDGTLKSDTFRSLSEDLAKPYLLSDGDVLLARTGATVGKSFMYAQSWGRCCFAGYLIKASLNKDIILAEWFYQYTNTQYYWEWIASNQIQATMPNVSADKYNNFVLAVPPLSEQVSILNHIKKSVNILNGLENRALAAIELMQERRTALISAAVTGKIDVRNWQAPQQ